jgi:hypothetical protein
MRPPPKISPPSLFLTPKAPAAIPVSDDLSYDVLCQAALDPAVTAIEFVRYVAVAGLPRRVDAIVLMRDGARRVVDIRDGGIRSLDDQGLRLLAIDKLGATPLPLTAAGILGEPRCSNARLVWEEHRRPVRMHFRTHVVETLEAGGATSIRRLGLRYREDVFALACETMVDIDLDTDPVEGGLVRLSTRLASSRLPFLAR